MDEKLACLKNIGFTRAGEWTLANDKLVFSLGSESSARNLLYAFSVDGQLRYIGKTVNTLKSRMMGYKNPGKRQPTNLKNNQLICEDLLRGKKVEIYVMVDNGLLHFGGFHVNMAAALEDSLIRDLEPQWNGGKKEGPNQTLRSIEPSSTIFSDTTTSKGLTSKKAPSADDFRAALDGVLRKAAHEQREFIDVSSGQVHRRVGGYPGKSHAIPSCCQVMRAAMNTCDKILAGPPSGIGASLTIRYVIPRTF